MLRAICRRSHLHFAAHDADHRHRRRAGGTARCKDSNFMESSRLRYLRDWSQAERGWFNVRGVGGVRRGISPTLWRNIYDDMMTALAPHLPASVPVGTVRSLPGRLSSTAGTPIVGIVMIRLHLRTLTKCKTDKSQQGHQGEKGHHPIWHASWRTSPSRMTEAIAPSNEVDMPVKSWTEGVELLHGFGK